VDTPASAASTTPSTSNVPLAGGRGWRRAGDILLGRDPRQRIRTGQWLVTVLVYLPCTLLLWFGERQGWITPSHLLGWVAFVLLALGSVYIALRSRWSERFAEPALTEAQMVLGVIAVNWGYLIGGPLRSAALLPLMLIFVFGAFSLGWRRILWLTVFALLSLIGSMLLLQSRLHIGEAWSMASPALRLDLANLLMVIILLPALSLMAARLSALRSRLRQQRAELTGALAEVQRLATRDELTGLANRRQILERLEQEQRHAERIDRPFCVSIIDIDNFKAINDRLGHAAGDEVLRAFARESAAMLRAGDLLGRWGGEEFLLLMRDTGAHQGEAAVWRMLHRLRALPWEGGAHLTFSAGVVEHRRGDQFADTVARADRVMYQAKRAGRNTVLSG
jgi:diguanylate cyclase